MVPPALATATSAHCANVTSPQRIGPRIGPRSAAHRANATSPQRIDARSKGTEDLVLQRYIGDEFGFILLSLHIRRFKGT
jgi:hypothetical protein